MPYPKSSNASRLSALPYRLVRKPSIAESVASSVPSSPAGSQAGLDPQYRFPPVSPPKPSGSSRTHFRSVHPSVGPAAAIAAGGRVTVSHPYARLHAMNSQEGGGMAKRRRMWNHALEKSVFTPHELSTIGAPHRRVIYTASMESHVDALHTQLLEYALFPVPFEKLEPYRGLNSKTAKSMVSGLQKDINDMKLKHLELQRAEGRGIPQPFHVVRGVNCRDVCLANYPSILKFFGYKAEQELRVYDEYAEAWKTIAASAKFSVPRRYNFAYVALQDATLPDSTHAEFGRRANLDPNPALGEPGVYADTHPMEYSERGRQRLRNAQRKYKLLKKRSNPAREVAV
ncbi:hypothetical protein EIP91_009710 [Steccherinum ochraceum]|uniref:Uncharacterized protein n=1 Tax=Steccherinum ochraceum TaxID=92696 RepID=A0A4R0R3L8_9APHY|nr:hypothetical protein EIP91_009710 [Steccherinum ochraceum]